MSHPIRVIALFIARDNQIAALQKLLQSLIPPTLQESGCIQYELHQNLSHPSDFAFIEEWRSEEDLDKHLNSEHVEEMKKIVGDFIVGDPDIRRYKLLD